MVLCASGNNRRNEARNCGRRKQHSSHCLHVELTTAYERARCESADSHILLLATCAAHAMDAYCVVYIWKVQPCTDHRYQPGQDDEAMMMMMHDDDGGGDGCA